MLRITGNFTQISHAESGPQPNGTDGAVSYDKAVDNREALDNPLPQFEKQARGIAVRQQYRAGIGQLSTFLKRHGRNAAPLRTFGERIEEGSTGFFSSEIGLLYGEGKRSFDQVCAAVNDERIPLDTRIAKVANLTEGLVVCANGALSNLIMAAQDLTLGAAGLRGNALQQWETLLDSCIREFAQKMHGKEHRFEGNEIHYVNAYRNFVADDFEVKGRTDNFAPRNLDTDLLTGCKTYVKERVTMTQVVRNLGEACLQDIHQTFDGYRGRSLSEADVGEIYNKYAQGTDTAIQGRYGRIDPSLLFVEEEVPDDQESTYRLIENPVLLMRQVALNLSEAGGIEPFKPIEVAQSSDGRRALEQIGDDIYYVRTRGQGPEDNYAPATLRDVARAFEDKDDDFCAGLMSQWPREYPRLRGNKWEGTVLHMAVKRGMLKSIAVIAGRKAELDLTDRNGFTPLMLAVRENNVDAIRCLLEHRASTKVFDKDRQTVLGQAASRGRVAAMRVLVEHGMTVDDVVDDLGSAPLHVAARVGNQEALEWLIRNGANVDKESDLGTPLACAVQNGNEEAVKLLLEVGAKVDEQLLKRMKSSRDHGPKYPEYEGTYPLLKSAKKRADAEAKAKAKANASAGTSWFKSLLK